MQLTEHTHPTLMQAFRMLREERGIFVDVTLVDLSSIADENLDTAEKALSKLSLEDLTDFTYGEASVQEAFIAQSLDLRIADLVLSAYFESLED